MISYNSYSRGQFFKLLINLEKNPKLQFGYNSSFIKNEFIDDIGI